MYDTLLYGNGLTIAVTNTLWNLVHDNKFANYLSLNNFIKDYIAMPTHRKLYRDFMKTFNKDTHAYEKIHIKNKKLITENLPYILDIGFERWVSKTIFDNNSISDIDRQDAMLYMYSLHNYWYHIITNEVLPQQLVKQKLKYCANQISKKIRNYILTINFDTLLDDWLNPQHLHGKFTIPYHNGKQLILFIEEDGHSFQYPYLFGGNGYEKLNRLDIINKRKLGENNPYNLDFFFGDLKKANYGHVLIYGIAFGRSYIMSDEFLDVYPKYKNLYLTYCIDGHILLKLEALYQNKCIDKITIAYYSEEDLNNYKQMISMTKLESIVIYEHTSNIFNF